jgi:inhibitor of KinA sporulation pathway (predicted exonuclease)
VLTPFCTELTGIT